MNRLEVGEILKRKRTEAGLTLTQMVEKLKNSGSEASINYLSSLERGGLELPNRMRLRQIALAYGMNPRTLSEVFYPSDDQLELEIKITRIFNEIVQDEMFDSETRKGLVHERVGIATMLFIIRLYEMAKKIKVLDLVNHPQSQDASFVEGTISESESKKNNLP